MKTFLVTVTTQYDGYEWLSRALVGAKNEKEAIKKAEGLILRMRMVLKCRK